MSKNFIVTVPVKPYVKRYIELNYGNPADFSSDASLQKLVHKCLSNPSTRYENKYENKLCTYTERIGIAISEDYFYRYGWQFTYTEIVNFGKTFEFVIKTKMILIVGTYTGMGLSFRHAIERYQERSGLSEQDWPYESIKKDYYRNKPREKINFFPQIISQIDKLILVKLSPEWDRFTAKKNQHEIFSKTS